MARKQAAADVAQERTIAVVELAARLGTTADELKATPGFPDEISVGVVRLVDVEFLLEGLFASPAPEESKPVVKKIEITLGLKTIELPLMSEADCESREFRKPPKEVLVRYSEAQKTAMRRLAGGLAASGKTYMDGTTPQPCLTHSDAMRFLLDQLVLCCAD